MIDIILVDANDQSIGHMEIKAAHEGRGQLHRAISVYLFRRHLVDGELQLETLIQQRSQKKFTGAGLWANTVCGNVRVGENYEECAYRRLREELGISVVHLTSIHKFRYQVQVNDTYSENEIDQAFAGWYDETVMPSSAEVTNHAWVSWTDLLKNTREEYAIQLLDSEQYLFEVKELTTSHQYSIAPWTVIMLHDQELVAQLTAYVSK